MIAKRNGDGMPYLYPTIFYEDMEISPSLMLNLLEYCLVGCERAGIQTELPEDHGGFLRFRLNSDNKKDETKLAHVLASGLPTDFEKANLGLVVLRANEYDLSKAIPKPIVARETIRKVTDIGDRKEDLMLKELVKEVGITMSSGFYDLLEQAGVVGRKEKIKRPGMKRITPVRLFSPEEVKRFKDFLRKTGRLKK